MLIFRFASGAAMFPYSVIKEVNPDEVKAALRGQSTFWCWHHGSDGAVLCKLFAKSLETTTNHVAHFQQTIWVLDHLLYCSRRREQFPSGDWPREAAAAAPAVDSARDSH